MDNINKLKTTLKVAILITIAFAVIMPVSATVFKDDSQSITTSQKQGLIVSNTIYVDDDNTEGPWDGSMECPYQYIQDGIDAACNGYEVYVFNGTYHENIVIFKYIYLTGENKDTTIIDGKGLDNVVEITAYGVYFVGFTVKNSGNDMYNAGISVFNNVATISENNIEDNNYGIRVIGYDNTIYFNNFERNVINAFEGGNNYWCIHPLGGNYWDDYTGIDEDEDGIGDTPYHIVENETHDALPLIHWYGSVKNLDTEIIYITIQDAIDCYLTEDSHTILVKNDIYPEHLNVHKSIILMGEDNRETIIDGREFGTVVRICDESIYLTGFTIRNSGSEYNDAGIIVTTDENIITENIIENNFHGIYLKHSSDDNEISHNKIRNNNWNGIYVESNCQINDGNIIFENTIENNDYAGIAMVDSSYNYIYHNNFIENLVNAYDNSNNIWDDEYPSGGNYWNDYTGGDSDGDGIGDTPYEIDDGINKDRYPLMEPYSSGDTTPPYIEITSPQNGLYLRNLRLLPFLLRQKTIIFGAITIEVDAVDSSGIEKIEFYIDAGSSPEETVYDEPYSWTWTRGSFMQSRYTITAVAYDNAGNINTDSIIVRKFL